MRVHKYNYLTSSLVNLASPAPSLTEEGAGDARLLVPCRHFGCMDGGGGGGGGGGGDLKDSTYDYSASVNFGSLVLWYFTVSASHLYCPKRVLSEGLGTCSLTGSAVSSTRQFNEDAVAG